MNISRLWHYKGFLLHLFTFLHILSFNYLYCYLTRYFSTASSHSFNLICLTDLKFGPLGSYPLIHQHADSELGESEVHSSTMPFTLDRRPVLEPTVKLRWALLHLISNLTHKLRLFPYHKGGIHCLKDLIWHLKVKTSRPITLHSLHSALKRH